MSYRVATSFSLFLSAGECWPSMNWWRPDDRSSRLSRQNPSPSASLRMAGVTTIGARIFRSPHAFPTACCSTRSCWCFGAAQRSFHIPGKSAASSTPHRFSRFPRLVPKKSAGPFFSSSLLVPLSDLLCLSEASLTLPRYLWRFGCRPLAGLMDPSRVGDAREVCAGNVIGRHQKAGPSARPP